MIIVLMGYMGSGKSTIGLRLSEVLNYKFIDLDNYISKKEQNTIPNLFKDKGEIYFRTIETKHLKHILNTSTHLVLSLGGGTPCYSNNLSLIKANKKTKSVYLNLSITQLAKRLNKEKQNRPLIKYLKTEEELTEFIGKHLFERSTFYLEADYNINCNNTTADEQVASIIMQLI